MLRVESQFSSGTTSAAAYTSAWSMRQSQWSSVRRSPCMIISASNRRHLSYFNSHLRRTNHEYIFGKTVAGDRIRTVSCTRNRRTVRDPLWTGKEGVGHFVHLGGLADDRGHRGA